MNSIVEKLAYYAGKLPEKVAVIADEEALTYKKLWEETQGFALYLQSLGVKKGDMVIVKSKHSLWFPVSCMGIHLSGGVHVPLEKSIGEEGLIEIADRFSAKVIISDSEVKKDGCIWIDANEVRKIAEENYVEGHVFTFPEAEDLCDIMFTTGTTGKSKGVMKTHFAVVTVAENTYAGELFADDNMYLVAVPINHVSGIRKLYVAINTGTSIALLDGFANLKKFYQYMADYKANSLYLPPSAVRMILLLSAKKLAMFKDQITFISVGSEAFAESDKEKIRELLPNSKLFFIYGSSEAGRITQLEYSKYPGLSNCIGVPTKDVEVFIVDDDRKVIQSSKDHLGFIAIKSPAAMTGYYNEPELTKEVLEDGIVYTNDVGYIDENGFIYMLGRKSDVINVGGLKISPTEVESVALKYPGIAECACFGVEDRISGIAPKLNVVLDAGAEIDTQELRNFMLKYLESFKVPKLVDIVSEIPKTLNGKINRKELK